MKHEITLRLEDEEMDYLKQVLVLANEWLDLDEKKCLRDMDQHRRYRNEGIYSEKDGQWHLEQDLKYLNDINGHQNLLKHIIRVLEEK